MSASVEARSIGTHNGVTALECGSRMQTRADGRRPTLGIGFFRDCAQRSAITRPSVGTISQPAMWIVCLGFGIK